MTPAVLSWSTSAAVWMGVVSCLARRRSAACRGPGGWRRRPGGAGSGPRARRCSSAARARGRTLTRAETKLRPFTTTADLIDTVLRLWREAGYREERYAAIALLDTPAARRLRNPAVLPVLRELIITGAWWDYVDEVAHRAGDLLLSWPAEIRPALLAWTRSEDRWLRRASIICQLGTRDRTDVELLTIAIDSAIGDSDFFLRKAIGWALRDYARTNPAWVRSFAETRELSPLSRREALKHLS